MFALDSLLCYLIVTCLRGASFSVCQRRKLMRPVLTKTPSPKRWEPCWKEQVYSQGIASGDCLLRPSLLVLPLVLPPPARQALGLVQPGWGLIRELEMAQVLVWSAPQLSRKKLSRKIVVNFFWWNVGRYLLVHGRRGRRLPGHISRAIFSFPVADPVVSVAGLAGPVGYVAAVIART